MQGQMPACSVAEASLFLAAFSPVAHMPAESSLLAHLRKSLVLDVSETIILPVTLGVDLQEFKGVTSSQHDLVFSKYRKCL